MGLGFSVGDVTMSAYFCIFGQLYLTLGANPMSHFLAQNCFGNRFEVWNRLPSVSGAKFMAKRPQFFQEFPRGLVGISLYSFWLFCHNLWTRNATKSIKPSKDSYCSLESQTIWATKSVRLVDLQGMMTPSKCAETCINILLFWKHQQKNNISSLSFFRSKLQDFTSL